MVTSALLFAMLYSRNMLGSTLPKKKATTGIGIQRAGATVAGAGPSVGVRRGIQRAGATVAGATPQAQAQTQPKISARRAAPKPMSGPGPAPGFHPQMQAQMQAQRNAGIQQAGATIAGAHPYIAADYAAQQQYDMQRQQQVDPGYSQPVQTFQQQQQQVNPNYVAELQRMRAYQGQQQSLQQNPQAAYEAMLRARRGY